MAVTRNLADGGKTPVSKASTKPAPPSPWFPKLGAATKPGGAFVQKPALRPAPPRPAAQAPRSPLSAALIAGGTGAAIGAAQPAPAPPPPTPIYSGSGSRVRGYSDGSGGGGGAVAPAAYQAPAVYSAPAATVQPPAIVNPAGPGAGNVAGQSFETVGQGEGTYGQEQRRRQARGPMTGLSMTPEMLRRAAGQRLG